MPASHARQCVAAGCFTEGAAIRPALPAALFVGMSGSVSPRQALFRHLIELRSDCHENINALPALVHAAIERSKLHGINWWIMEQAGDTPTWQCTANFLRLALKKKAAKVAILSVASIGRGSSDCSPKDAPKDLVSRLASVDSSDVFPAVDCHLPFRLLLSYIHPSSTSLPPLLTSLQRQDRLAFAPHLASLLPRPELNQIIAARQQQGSDGSEDTTRCYILSVGDANRHHEVLIHAAKKMAGEVHLRVISGLGDASKADERSKAVRTARADCLASSYCQWDDKPWARWRVLSELQRPDVCAVAVPLTDHEPVKLGIGLTSVIEAVTRGVPVLTLDYDHFAHYLRRGCNAHLVTRPSVGHAVGAVMSGYAKGLADLVRRRAAYQECAEQHAAANFTVERVGDALNSTLRRLERRL